MTLCLKFCQEYPHFFDFAAEVVIRLFTIQPLKRLNSVVSPVNLVSKLGLSLLPCLQLVLTLRFNLDDLCLQSIALRLQLCMLGLDRLGLLELRMESLVFLSNSIVIPIGILLLTLRRVLVLSKAIVQLIILRTKYFNFMTKVIVLNKKLIALRLDLLRVEECNAELGYGVVAFLRDSLRGDLIDGVLAFGTLKTAAKRFNLGLQAYNILARYTKVLFRAAYVSSQLSSCPSYYPHRQ